MQPPDWRATVIAAVVARRWEPKLLYSPNGPVEVLLHMGTGWALSPVPNGWIAVHSITAVIVRDGLLPRVWQDKTAAMVELEITCPDCYGVDLPAPCASCEGSGRLGRESYAS
jgi:hypothetical protein